MMEINMQRKLHFITFELEKQNLTGCPQKISNPPPKKLNTSPKKK